jgi:hypothetical protein
MSVTISFVSNGQDTGLGELHDAAVGCRSLLLGFRTCAIVNLNLSLAEWKQYLGRETTYEKTCPGLPAARERTAK